MGYIQSNKRKTTRIFFLTSITNENCFLLNNFRKRKILIVVNFLVDFLLYIPD